MLESRLHALIRYSPFEVQKGQQAQQVPEKQQRIHDVNLLILLLLGIAIHYYADLQIRETDLQQR